MEQAQVKGEGVNNGGGEIVSGCEVTHTHTHSQSPFPDPEPGPEPDEGLFFVATAAPPKKLRPIRSHNNINVVNGNSTSRNNNNTSINQFHFNGNGNAVMDETETVTEMSTAELVKIKSEMDANFISAFRSHISNLPFSPSSSSDGSGDSAPDKAHNNNSGPVADTDSPTAKPQTKKRKKFESFLHNLMTQVIHKQEQMHQQLMDTIERKERERIIREEAWRRQEADRAKRDQEIRSQEAARSLALVSLIQKTLGHIQPLCPLKDHTHQSDSLQGEGDQYCNFDDPNNKRWPTPEVQALITLRTALDHKFRTLAPKTPVWEEISAAMANMGYIRNAKKCKEKWENINKYFKKATANGNNRSDNAKSCPYFHELETLYRNHLITTTAKPNSPNHQLVVHNRNQIQS